MPLPTAATVRDLGLPGFTGTGEDTRISALVTAADSALARYCGWPAPTDGVGLHTFEETTYVQLYDGPDPEQPSRLTLGLRPISSITAIIQDTNGDWSYTESLTAVTDYLTDDQNGRVYLNPTSTKAWLTGLRSIQVTCVAGYDVGAEPSLTQAIVFLVAHWWLLRSSTPTPQIVSYAGKSVTLKGDGLPQVVKELVAPFRLWERETHWRHG